MMRADFMIYMYEMCAMFSYITSCTFICAKVRVTVRDTFISHVLKNFNYEKIFLKVLNFNYVCFRFIYVFEIESVPHYKGLLIN